MGKLTPEKIKDIQTEYAKCHSYTETAKKVGVDERTAKKHAHGPIGNSSTTNHGSIGKTISNKGTDDTEMNKTIYKELRKGMKPDQIIEKHGFPSGYVQAEFELFSRNRDTDMIEFQKEFITIFVKDVSPDLQSCISTFNERGHLTRYELLEVMLKIIEESADDAVSKQVAKMAPGRTLTTPKKSKLRQALSSHYQEI